MRKIKTKSVTFKIFLLISVYVILFFLEVLLLFVLDGYLLLEEIDFLFFQCLYKGIITLGIILLYRHNKSLKTTSYFESIDYKDFFIIFVLAFFLRIVVDPIFRIEEILNGLPSSLAKEYPSPIFDLSDIIIFFNIVLFSSLFEELFFRGYVLQTLLFNKIKVEYAILISSLLFGIVHIEVHQIIIGFILGWLTSIVFLKKGIIGSVLLHLAYNFIWFVLDHFRNEYWVLIELLDFGIFYYIIFSIVLIMLFTIIKFKFSSPMLEVYKDVQNKQ